MPPTFDDLRLMLKEAAPQVVLMDRPVNATLEFLLACVAQGIAILSLGPPVESLAEAQALSGPLGSRTHLLYTWPRFSDAPAARQCAEADEFARPIRFASATWTGMNYALAKALPAETGAAAAATGGWGPARDAGAALPVRSLSVLAWDAIDTLIHLMEMPHSVYAVVRGTVGSGNSFGDLTGAAALTLRFADDAAAGITLCDRTVSSTRDLMLWGAGGTLRLQTQGYEFRDADGKLIDAKEIRDAAASASSQTGRGQAEAALREFLRHFAMPPSPHRGWKNRLEEIAATLEAMVVSHRTGQAESPERLRHLRR